MLAVFIEKICHTLERRGCFATAGCALHNEHTCPVITDNPVLLLLNGRYNTLHLCIRSSTEHGLQQLITNRDPCVKHKPDTTIPNDKLSLHLYITADLPTGCMIRDWTRCSVIIQVGDWRTPVVDQKRFFLLIQQRCNAEINAFCIWISVFFEINAPKIR